MLVAPGVLDLRARGRVALPLDGWDRYSVWGWDDQEHCLFAQLWRNTDDGSDRPRVWITPVAGWPATGLPEVLAGWIAEATGCARRDVLVALAAQAPELIVAHLRRVAYASKS